MAELLRLGAGKGGDAVFGKQLPRGAVDGGRGDQKPLGQLQVPVVLHHPHKPRLRFKGPSGILGCMDQGQGCLGILGW